MKSFDFENFSENDWDEKGELLWNEFDWSRYIQDSNILISKFTALYLNNFQEDNRLDVTASQLPWQASEWLWSNTNSQEAVETMFLDSIEDIDDESDSFKDILATHRHPLFIGMTALCFVIAMLLEDYVDNNSNIDGKYLLKLTNSFHKIELNAILAIHAFDIGDCSLSISYCKISFDPLNQALDLTSSIQEIIGNTLATKIKTILFDIREVLLRLITNCRAEIKDHYSPSESEG